jgi:type II secretory pathway component GspD/PulD (secretin)
MLGVLAIALLGGCASQPVKTEPEHVEKPAPAPEPKVEYEPLKLGESFVYVYTSAIRQGAIDIDASIPPFEEAKHTDSIISIETRLIELPMEAARELFGSDGMPQVYAVATTESGALLKALLDDKRANVISSPRLTCYDKQRANISVVTQHAFVSGFEVNDSKGARVLDPVVETVNDGLVLALKPEIKDGKISLEINLAEAELVKPIAEGEVKLDGATLKLQLPVLHMQTLATKASVEDGGTIMVSRTKSTDKSKCIVMFVTVRKAE